MQACMHLSLSLPHPPSIALSLSSPYSYLALSVSTRIGMSMISNSQFIRFSFLKSLGEEHLGLGNKLKEFLNLSMYSIHTQFSINFVVSVLDLVYFWVYPYSSTCNYLIFYNPTHILTFSWL